MKLKIYLWSAVLLLAACDRNVETIPAEITVDAPRIVLPEYMDDNQAATVTFTATAPWSAETSDTKAAADWIRISPRSGGPGTVTLSVFAEENRTPQERTAYIRILSGDATQSIGVTQKGDGTLPEGQSIYETGAARDTIVVRLHAGGNYRVDIGQGADWVVSRLSAGEKFDTLAFFLTANHSFEDRAVSIRIYEPQRGYTSSLTLLQLSAALDIELALRHVRLPTGTAGTEAAADWTESLFVAGFDDRGDLLFTQDLPRAEGYAFRFRVLPPETAIRNSYPSVRIYAVANSSHELAAFAGNEQDFLNRKDTAATKLFDAENIRPPLSGTAVCNLGPGTNKVEVDLAHVTALVTFNVFFDSDWTDVPSIDKLSIGGFSSWGYLFGAATDTQSPPRATAFNPTVTPNGTNRYLFFAYEKSRLILTVRAGGRYYQGVAPDILKRGYKYTFNMRLCPDGQCRPSSETEHLARASVTTGEGERTIYLKPM